ncbi:MAG: Eco57I restriction-modification methylase domain-containing protein [bacterium]
MNQQQAKRLLDNTFNNEFDNSRVLNFLKEFLNLSDLYSQDKTQYIPKQFREYILGINKIGEYTDRQNKTIELLTIKLAKHWSLERARTMQRNFIAKWLANNSNEPEGAIVAFYDEEEPDWRFSFVKLEYNLVKDEKGNLKAKKELTPAKRYSYLVGPNEPNHTCQSQFKALLLDTINDPSLEDIESSFGIEKVTKEFFEKYKRRFLELKESLDKIVSKDQNIKNEFMKIAGENEQELERFVVEFSKKLLGQIVFLYFLQKKGWLGVRKDDTGRFMDWGTGPKDFMRRLFNKEYCSYNNFFNDVLEPLFYNTLAIKRTEDFSDKFDCKIPFLNGGLFEPLDGYDWMNTEIKLDNAIFKEIFDTFDEFNFTVKEDEPLEKEVAVDPEMLGKVFENLLEVTDRKSKGAFYTPREIVHYMCQQSLINYLETNTNIDRADIEKFIQEGDKLLDQTIKAQEHKKKYHGNVYDVDANYMVPKSIEENYQKVDNLLKEIKVVDPAVGSGAFPVGMMNEIVKARSILSVYFEDERDTSDLKRSCIENCLYGVDVMPSAVDICQLRFWLSLVVDELERKRIKPLPNLDNKIMCGNSLLEEFEGIKLFDESLLNGQNKDIKEEVERIDREINDLYLKLGQIETGKIKHGKQETKKEIKKLERKKVSLNKTETHERNLRLDEIGKKRNEAKAKLNELKTKQEKFFNSSDNETKKKLKIDIEQLEWELIEVTLEEQGNEEALERLNIIMRGKSKPFFLWRLYFSEVFQKKTPGFDIVIANPPYVRVDDIDKLLRTQYKRKYQTAQGKYDLYYLFFELAFRISSKEGTLVFITPNKFCAADSARNLRNILLNHENRISITSTSKLKVFESASNYPIISVIKKNSDRTGVFFEEAKELDFTGLKSSNSRYYCSIRNMENIPDQVIPINVKQSQLDLVIKLFGNNSKLLSSILVINEGLRIPRKLEKEEGPGLEIVKQYQFSKYSVISRGSFIDKEEFANVCSLNSSRYKNIMQEKILIAEDALRINATLDTRKRIPQGGVYFAVPINDVDLKFILGILNSSLFSALYEILYAGMHMGGGYLRYRSKFLGNLPVSDSFASSNKKVQQQLINMVYNLLKKSNNEKTDMLKDLENKIDSLVYKLYNLTSEEIQIIEGLEKQ